MCVTELHKRCFLGLPVDKKRNSGFVLSVVFFVNRWRRKVK